MPLIRTINTSTVTERVADQLRQWPGLVGATVERNAPPNRTLGRMPWIGIYRNSVELAPRTLGHGAGYRSQVISLVIMCQHGDMNSGEDCEKKVDQLVQEVTSALCSDESLRGVVDTLENLSVAYPAPERDGQAYIQAAMIQFSARVMVAIV